MPHLWWKIHPGTSRRDSKKFPELPSLLPGGIGPSLGLSSSAHPPSFVPLLTKPPWLADCHSESPGTEVAGAGSPALDKVEILHEPAVTFAQVVSSRSAVAGAPGTFLFQFS